MKYNDLELIQTLAEGTDGEVLVNGQKISARLRKDADQYLFQIDSLIGFPVDELTFDFWATEFKGRITGFVTKEDNQISAEEKGIQQYSEGKISCIESENWQEEKGFYRCFLNANSSSVLYDVFGKVGNISVSVDGHKFGLYTVGEQVVVESQTEIKYSDFEDLSYLIMVCLGFLGGKFVQREKFTFCYTDDSFGSSIGFKYRKLRPSNYSISKAFAGNPIFYSHLVGDKAARHLFESGEFKYASEDTFNCFVAAVLQNSQLQYALVLFNEANSKELSLLIRNNCFYAVLEVLKKYFHDLYSDRLSKGYSSLGNINKYKAIFQCIIDIDEEELSVLEKRNVFLHGDVKGVTGKEMSDLAYRQQTLIYRLLLTHIGFDGYAIDHYQLQNGGGPKAFVQIKSSVL